MDIFPSQISLPNQMEPQLQRTAIVHIAYGMTRISGGVVDKIPISYTIVSSNIAMETTRSRRPTETTTAPCILTAFDTTSRCSFDLEMWITQKVVPLEFQ